MFNWHPWEHRRMYSGELSIWHPMPGPDFVKEAYRSYICSYCGSKEVELCYSLKEESSSIRDYFCLEKREAIRDKKPFVDRNKKFIGFSCEDHSVGDLMLIARDRILEWKKWL